MGTCPTLNQHTRIGGSTPIVEATDSPNLPEHVAKQLNFTYPVRWKALPLGERHQFGTNLLRTLEQHVRAVDVVLGELESSQPRTVSPMCCFDHVSPPESHSQSVL